METHTRKVGSASEEMAENFLRDLGYEIVKKNFQFGRVGEIDIVARDGLVLVFVEVKSRSSLDFGTPEDAITPRKRQQIRKVAKAYLYVNDINDVECRFDVVAIDESGSKRELRHWINAFW